MMKKPLSWLFLWRVFRTMNQLANVEPEESTRRSRIIETLAEFSADPQAQKWRHHIAKQVHP